MAPQGSTTASIREPMQAGSSVAMRPLEAVRGQEASDPSRARQVELILSRVDTLPTLSPVATRVMQLGSSDGVEIEELATIIESDPALTARILGLCRRADKGLGDRIVSVKRAVVMLGLEAVRAAVLSVAVYDALKPLDDPRQREIERSVRGDGGLGDATIFDRAGFWKYSIGVACAAELLAQRAPTSSRRVLPEEAFVCGLLHAIGRVALQWLLPNAYERAVQLAHARGATLASLERQLFGLDYHTAGKRLAQRWQLPSCVHDSIWLHDQGASLAGPTAPSPHAALIAIITAARAIARAAHLGFCGDGDAPPDVARVLREHRIDGEAQELTGVLHERVAERAQLLGLDDADAPTLLLQSLGQASARLSVLHEQAQQRAALSQTQSRILSAITSFHERAGRCLTPEDSYEALAQSAISLLGQGFFALLLPGDRKDAPHTPDAGAPPCTLYQFQSSGRIGVVRHVEPPATLREQFSVAALTHEGAMSISALGLLPWLGDELIDAPDLRTLTLVPIAGEANTSFEGAALLTDRALAGEQDYSGYAPRHAPMDKQLLRPLLAAWSVGLRHAADRAHAQHLHEQLVASGRALSEAQLQIAEHEAMARLGETTAGAAHEMNNPLAVISGRAQLLLTRSRDAKDRAALQAIADASTQVSGLVESLHLLSKRPTPQERACDLAETVRHITEKAREQASPNADVSLELARLPRLVSLDADLLRGALHELIVNALEANPRGPILVTGLVDAGERALIVRVSDSGPGLSDKARQHAFDPFFSERPAGRGRGLGLARAKTYAEALDGAISLQSPFPPGSKGGTQATLMVRRWTTLA